MNIHAPGENLIQKRVYFEQSAFSLIARKKQYILLALMLRECISGSLTREIIILAALQEYDAGACCIRYTTLDAAQIISSDTTNAVAACSPYSGVFKIFPR